MRARNLSAGMLLSLAACALQPGGREAPLERVDDGLYTMQFPARRIEGAMLMAARVTIIAGAKGVVVIDSGLSAHDGASILEAVERATHAPVRLLVLSHPSQEAIFGASAFADRGIPVAMTREAAALVAARCMACLERLRLTLGDAVMAGTRLIAPERILEDGDVIEDGGRALRVIAPRRSSAPGALALLDEASGTLVAGSMVLVRAVPDVRDADLAGWRSALDRVAAMHCRRLVPAYGSLGSCDDAPAFRAYLDALEARVSELRAHGAELGDMEAAAEVARYAGWSRYADLHPANAARIYLRLEQEDLAKP